VRLALSFGLCTGIAEVVVIVVRKLLASGKKEIWVLPSDFYWLIPVADLIVFLSVGLVLWAVSRLWPHRVTHFAVVFVLACLFFLTILLPLPLHEVAQLVLALGLGLQTARLLGGRPERRAAQP